MNSLISSKTNSPLKIIFMGTPDFSIKPLKALLGSTNNIIAIYSQPPRKSGRGMKENKTPCLLYTSPSPRDKRQSRMPSSA